MGHFIRILEELHRSIDAICGEKPCDVGADPERFEEAVMFMALCIGGINISRAVDSKDLSDQILNICLTATVRVANRIADQTLNFHAEINCPGRVDIGTRIAKIGRSSITFEQALFRNGRMHATAKTVIMQMNETTRRSEPLSIEAIEHLNRLIPRF